MHNETWYDRAGGELVLSVKETPNKYRVNGLVANFKEFETAFSCKPGQPMAPVNRCRVW